MNYHINKIIFQFLYLNHLLAVNVQPESFNNKRFVLLNSVLLQLSLCFSSIKQIDEPDS